MTEQDVTETRKRESDRAVAEESRAENRESADGGGIDMDRFGRFVRERRKSRELTQRQLAERLYVSNKAVSKWERGVSHS